MNKFLALAALLVIAGCLMERYEKDPMTASTHDASTLHHASDGVVEIIRYNLPEEIVSDFPTIYEDVSKYLAASPHCRRYQVLRGIEDPNRFIIVIEWDSIEGHQEGFTNSADFPKFIAPLRPYLQYIEEMKHYEKTNIAWKE